MAGSYTKTEDSIKIISPAQVQSLLKMRVALYVIGIFQFVQLVLYALSGNDTYNDLSLMGIKAVALIIVCFFVFQINDRIRRENVQQMDHSTLLGFIFAATLTLGIINTFKAQSITSDISIYLLVLFVNSAIVLLRPRVMAGIMIYGYLLFSVGLPFYQKNTEYLIAHLVNGLIFNIIAFVIANMFYNHILSEYTVKNEIQMKNKRLIFLAQHDGLTETYNHQTIHELLENMISTARQEEITILLIDLDRFKEVNDIFGHKTGDSVLKQVAHTIESNLRLNDRIGRYGGDKFLILLPNTSVTEGRLMAERILDQVRKIQMADFQLTCSCGLTQWREDSSTQLIERADRAMYSVKKNGRNGVCDL